MPRAGSRRRHPMASGFTPSLFAAVSAVALARWAGLGWERQCRVL